MIVIIVATILILTMAYYQVRQGLFSALIMTILTIVCAAVALNYYPAVGEAFLYSRQGAYADAVALIALFVLPLIALRLVFDRFVAGNVVFGLWADRVGGGVLGLITGMVLVGMLLIVMQMLPFGESVLGYRPYDDALQRDQTVWPFCPDDFTVAVGSAVSGGAMNDEGSFDKLHDDLLLECFCARNTAGKHGSVQAVPKTLSIEGAYEPPAGPNAPSWLVDVPDDHPLLEMGGLTKVIVLRTRVDATAADADKWWRLPGTHFRLVDRDGRSHYPLGCLAVERLVDKKAKKAVEQFRFVSAPRADEKLQLARLIVERPVSPTRTRVLWVYRMKDTDQPDYVVFRRVSRSAVPKPRTADALPYAIGGAVVSADNRSRLRFAEFMIRLVGIGAPKDKKGLYILIYAIDSKDDMAAVAKQVMDGAPPRPLDPKRHIGRSAEPDGTGFCLLGRHGQGALQYTETVAPPGAGGTSAKKRRTVKGVDLCGMKLLGSQPPTAVLASSIGAGTPCEAKKDVLVKAQLWHRKAGKWSPVSRVFQKKLSVKKVARSRSGRKKT